VTRFTCTSTSTSSSMRRGGIGYCGQVTARLRLLGMSVSSLTLPHETARVQIFKRQVNGRGGDRTARRLKDEKSRCRALFGAYKK
jgi:hypothetical protein